MKIKVIDLLNMISKGEEVPKNIKYENKIYEYDNYCSNYVCDDEIGIHLLSHILDYYETIDNGLNDYIEIISDPKKIEHIESYAVFETLTNEGKFDYLYEMQTRIMDKVNEVE